MAKYLDKIKQELAERRAMDMLLDPEGTKQKERKIVQGLRDVPVSMIVEQLQYLENELLPRVEKGKGTAADKIFFKKLVESLFWSLIVIDRYEALLSRIDNLQLDVQLYKERMQLIERELQKYQTLEELLFTDGVNKYVENILARVQELKKKRRGDMEKPAE